MYFASEAYGAWLEKLARFRPIADIAARINAAVDDEGDDREEDDELVATLDESFFEPLVLGEVQIAHEARFIDVEHERTYQALSQRVGRPFLDRFGLERFDAAVPHSQDRNVTRQLALELHDMVRDDVHVVGLRFRSAHAGGVYCWSLWERAGNYMHEHGVAPVDLTNPALRHAAAVLAVELPSPSAPDQLPPGIPEPW